MTIYNLSRVCLRYLSADIGHAPKNAIRRQGTVPERTVERCQHRIRQKTAGPKSLWCRCRD